MQACRTLLLPFLLLAIAGPLRADPLDETVRQEMEAHGIPGLSLAIVQDGAIVSARAYGETGKAGGQPVTPQTHFQAGSVSKPVCAMAALQLAAQGHLSLDADVNDALKSWKVPSNPYTQQHPVTLRLILCHDAGFTVHGFDGYPQNHALPRLVQILNGTPPANSAPVRVVSVPGDPATWAYSGGGYEVMQQLVDDTTGQPFPEFVGMTVLAPLGMTESTFKRPLPAEWRETAARGHRLDGAPVEGGWHLYPEEAAAGLWTTPSDLGRFLLGVQGGLKGKGPVPQQVAQWMTTPAVGDDALGLFVKGPKHGIFLHDGRNDGYDTLLYFSRNLGLAAMINKNDDSGVLHRIQVAVWQQYQRKAPQD